MTELGKLLDERGWKINVKPMTNVNERLWLVITITRADGSEVHKATAGELDDISCYAIWDTLARIKNGR